MTPTGDALVDALMQCEQDSTAQQLAKEREAIAKMLEDLADKIRARGKR
jgi:hypothetical protein